MLSCMFSWYALGLFSLNLFPSFFMSQLLLKPEEKIQYSMIWKFFPSITNSSPTQHGNRVCVQDSQQRIFLGDYAGKYLRSFFSEPFPQKLFFRSDVMEKASPPSKYTHPALNTPNQFVHLPDISRSALFRRCQATAF